MVRMKEEEEAEEAAEAQQRVEERVEGLEEDDEAAWNERLAAQWKGEDVGWSSLADEENLHAPPGVTDEEVMQRLKANYDADARAELKAIFLFNTQVTDAAITALAKGCPGLRYIWLDNTQVTDAAATVLAKGCPGLQHIGLYNTQVTPSLAKVWNDNATAEHKQHPGYGGTIADFHKQLRRVTDKKKGKPKKNENGGFDFGQLPSSWPIDR
jgi:hypothetical protein